MKDEAFIIATMRRQAWQRAKGELNAMLEAYSDDKTLSPPWREIDGKVKKFIADVDEHLRNEEM